MGFFIPSYGPKGSAEYTIWLLFKFHPLNMSKELNNVLHFPSTTSLKDSTTRFVVPPKGQEPPQVYFLECQGLRP